MAVYWLAATLGNTFASIESFYKGNRRSLRIVVLTNFVLFG